MLRIKPDDECLINAYNFYCHCSMRVVTKLRVKKEGKPLDRWVMDDNGAPGLCFRVHALCSEPGPLLPVKG